MNTEDIFILLLRFGVDELHGIVRCTYAPQAFKDVARDMLLNIYTGC